MGLTIHWSFQGPQNKTEAKAIIEKLRQRAMDLPFESVSEIVSFKGEDAQFDRDRKNDPFNWLKIQAIQTVWSKDGKSGWDCLTKEIIGFQILVAPGSEPMEIFLATYPKTILIEDRWWGKRKRLRTGLAGWYGRSFTKTQYASNADCGGVPNFLRAHLSVVRMLDYAKELGLLADVSDEGQFFEKRDIPALVKEIGEWNDFIAAFVGAIDDEVGQRAVAPIKEFANFEHLEAKGQNQIDAFLQMLKEKSKPFSPAA